MYQADQAQEIAFELDGGVPSACHDAADNTMVLVGVKDYVSGNNAKAWAVKLQLR